MNLIIKKLTPALVDDYARFFDETYHNEAGHGEKCYCVTHCADRAYKNGGAHWYNIPEERRTHGLQRVKDGDIQGYLAYDGSVPVGWCNANDKENCKEIIAYWRDYGNVPIEKSKAGERVKMIFCFTIAPAYQNKGIATLMLQHICKEATEEGYHFLEGNTHLKFFQDGFRGPLALYEKCGFIIHAEKEGNVVVRKEL
ncbi:MAG: GNAT family N-acetyltransferase [Defluviitaleaceae bacterium]|nr:GNAT family N-acetyltransferase [Defluviitaleaceae bacterium]MCL2275537.1 GNAT family N-acetyltransferase [Defluviitaleaceae bacterium]